MNDPDSWGVAPTSGFEDKSHVDTDGASCREHSENNSQLGLQLA